MEGGLMVAPASPTETEGRMNELKRLVLDYRTGELIVRCLYQRKDGPNPQTKARAKEVTELARTGLQDALEALRGDVTMCGTSGFVQREDIFVATTSPDAPKTEKRVVKEAS
jgi:hypothetical protein